MDTRVLLICGLAAGFLMCVAALAGRIDMSRTRMQAIAKTPICRPTETAATNPKVGTAVPVR